MNIISLPPKVTAAPSEAHSGYTDVTTGRGHSEPDNSNLTLYDKIYPLHFGDSPLARRHSTGHGTDGDCRPAALRTLRRHRHRPRTRSGRKYPRRRSPLQAPRPATQHRSAKKPGAPLPLRFALHAPSYERRRLPLGSERRQTALHGHQQRVGDMDRSRRTRL